MSTWRLTYIADAVGDTPLPRTLDGVEIDTAGLDVYGDDEQKVIALLNAKLAEHAGEGATLTDAELVDEQAG